MKKYAIVGGIIFVLLACFVFYKIGIGVGAKQIPNTQEISTVTPSDNEVQNNDKVNEAILGLYMTMNDLTLSAKDVQFDMENSIEKKFAIKGDAELSDYYNYGFDKSKESELFCISVTPDGGKYSDMWHLYLRRDDFSKTFDTLKDGKHNIVATCMIPESCYESGQGNMAYVYKIAMND